MKISPITMAALIFFGTAELAAQDYSAKEANSFAVDMYKVLANNNNDNVFFSPFSLSLALGMTYAGAEGETKQQISEVLNFPINDSDLHKQLGLLQNKLIGKSSKGVEVSIANQIWADKNYKFKCKYTRSVSRNYSAPIKRVDFYSKPDESRLEINSWVELQTRDRIKDLLPDGSISSLTKMVLTNAIYFKGQWDNKFDKDLSKEDTFFKSVDEKIVTTFMNERAKYNIYNGDDLQMLELPYTGKDFSMLVILPNDKVDLKEVESHLTFNSISSYANQLVEKDVVVSLPKFKFNAEYGLKPVFSSMGMPLPFTNSADFSRMSGNKDLKIDEVFHKAFVEVSEEGTEAAAATAVVIVLKSVVIPVEFIANRPFIFVIRENSTGAFLFMGRVTNP
jgi:serpin B